MEQVTPITADAPSNAVHNKSEVDENATNLLAENKVEIQATPASTDHDTPLLYPKCMNIGAILTAVDRKGDFGSQSLQSQQQCILLEIMAKIGPC